MLPDLESLRCFEAAATTLSFSGMGQSSFGVLGWECDARYAPGWSSAGDLGETDLPEGVERGVDENAEDLDFFC